MRPPGVKHLHRSSTTTTIAATSTAPLPARSRAWNLHQRLPSGQVACYSANAPAGAAWRAPPQLAWPEHMPAPCLRLPRKAGHAANGRWLRHTRCCAVQCRPPHALTRASPVVHDDARVDGPGAEALIRAMRLVVLGQRAPVRQAQHAVVPATRPAQGGGRGGAGGQRLGLAAAAGDIHMVSVHAAPCGARGPSLPLLVGGWS